jgi:hypothetical protein
MKASGKSAPASAQTNLDTAAIPLQLIRDDAVKALVKLVSKVESYNSVLTAQCGEEREPKIMFLDPSLSGPLGLLFDVSFLKVCVFSEAN